MSNFPQNFDDDTTLPIVNDNLTEIGGDAINALRDAVFNVEQNIGLGAAGTTPSIAARLGLLINPDGSPNASTFTSLGLVTLPITNNQIIDNAGIPESKLRLDYRTQDLFNYIRDLSKSVSAANQWISVSGVKLDPHIMGFIYRHDLSQIDVGASSSLFLDNKFRTLRDNTNAYTLINDMNNELLAHQWADGSPFGTIANIVTNDGSVYPSNYAHTASGIFLNTSRFFTIPQTNDDLQQFAEYIDGASIFLLGTRIQNLYTNGISKVSRSSSLLIDGYGQAIVPVTPAIAFLDSNGNSSTPIDDISMGDDIIQFQPSAGALSSNIFVSQFAAVKIGDIVRVNYGTVEIAWLVKEKKYIQSSNTFIVRINGKNIAYTPGATARIDRALFNSNKYGVLATAPVPVTGIVNATPSLIVATPRGAQALGIGFNADQFDNTHYLLYLALYPTGNPQDGYTILPPIDVTGNQGATPGSYTLDSVVNTANLAFRQPGYNYRFIAFQYQGEFGIMLADSYNNVSFSILSATVIQSGSSAGNYDPVGTGTSFHNNVVGIFPSNLTGTFAVTNGTNAVTASVSQTGSLAIGSIIIFNSQPGFSYTVATVAGTAITLTAAFSGTTSLSATAYLPLGSASPDPLGFGPFGANVASPPYVSSYGSPQAAQVPTKLFVPLKRNNYYVNGVELERMSLDVGQALDTFGDGYWVANIQNINAGLTNLSVTYRVQLNLTSSRLKVGKTLVVQSLGQGGLVNFGRFIISDVEFVNCNSSIYTDITVYDAVHANGSSPTNTTLPINSQVSLYFNSDSVSFNKENASDLVAITPPSFKRHFEVYVDELTNTYTNERGRFNLSSINPLSIDNGIPLWNDNNLSVINLVAISPKLRGYQFGFVNKITLNLISLNASTGIFSGYLCSWDGTIGHPFLNQGPLTTGKMGEIVRFYDETNIDFIDFTFDLSISIPSITNKQLDIQLFPSLALDAEEMLLSTCQMNDNTGVINHIVDQRQFGNTSEKDLSTSALNLISSSTRLLNMNGVVRGFDLENITPNPNSGQIYMTGGMALVNGNFIQMNNQTVSIPPVKELYLSTQYNINWILCVNQQGEYQPVPLLDYDPILATPNNPQRIVNLFNILNSQTYAVDATTFSDLINNRKDLAPLYFVASTTTTPSSISLVMQDVRRFVNDQDSIITPTLTSGASQGNFKNFNAALHWLVFNSSYQNTLQVKGSYTIPNDLGLLNTGQNYQISNQSGSSSLTFSSAMAVSSVQLNELILSFLGSLVSEGNIFTKCPSVSVATNFISNNGNNIFDGCPTVSVVGSYTVNAGSNTFTNSNVVSIGGSFTANTVSNTFSHCATVNVSGNFTANTGSTTFDTCSVVNILGTLTANNISFNYGTITISNGVSATNPIFKNASVNITNGLTATNPVFENCTVVITGNVNVSNATFTNCLVSVSSNLIANNSTFNNCVITLSGSTITLGANIAFNGCTLTISSSASNGLTLATSSRFVDCTMNIPCAIGFTLASDTIFRDTTINYTYDATSDGYFASSNIVNVAKACLFYNITSSTSINNIVVDNCIFNSPTVNRFSFISFLFASSACFAEDITITDNKFYTTYNGDDRGAVIAFAAPALVSSSLTGPRLTNCVIENNYCNKDQMIVVSSIPNVAAIQEAMVGVNVRIVGNTCGAINVLTKRDTPLTAYAGTNPAKDKDEGTIITQNNCKFIFSGFANGFMVDTSDHRAINNVGAGIFTGSLLIEDNICSFIHTGIRVSSTIYTNGIPLLKIRNNKIAANDTTSFSGFLVPYYRGFSNVQIAIAILIDRVSGT